MNMLQRIWSEIRQYPSALAGAFIVILLVGISLYTVIAIPYAEAVRFWRGGEEIWYNSPKTAQPQWINWFQSEKLPETLVLNSADGAIEKITSAEGESATAIRMAFPIEYSYDGFPTELSLIFTSKFSEKMPHVTLTWLTPDGREIRVASIALEKSLQTYRLSQDERLQRRLGGQEPQIGLFADPENTEPAPVKGEYILQVEGLVFEPDSDIDCEFVMFGQVAGWAGTDHRRRDLSIGLLWGAPIALAFGMLAAIGTSVLTLLIAAVSAWYGGWLDQFIQRLTEINLILPLLPILIMVGTFYSRSIWLMLGMVVLLNIFGGAILTYRTMFLQVKSAGYIEAALAYGAGNWRIVLRYLLPRIIPLLIPQFVIGIPLYVFLEAALAVLGLGDPILPSWGKIINEANANGALYNGLYYWVLQPSALLMITGLGFAVLGYSLDRIFNPRLRQV